MINKKIKRVDIAKLARVSEATVSLALNGSPRVKASTRKQIEEISREAGYIPDRAARSLRNTGSNKKGIEQIGFLVLNRSNEPFLNSYLMMLIGAEQASFSLKSQLVFNRIDCEHDIQRLRMLSQENIDAWLIAGYIPDEILKIIQSWDRPFVILGNKEASGLSNQVYVDHELAGRMAVEYLFKHGHKSIAIINGSLTVQYQREILKGYSDAMKDLVGSCDSTNIFDSTSSTFLKRIEEQSSSANFPTACICAEGSFVAEGNEFVSFLKSKYSLSSDVVVIDLEHVEKKKKTYPTVTTVGPSLGEAGIRLLADIALNNKKSEHILKISPILHEV